MNSKENIQGLFETHNELTIKEIVDKLGISKQMAHISVRKLTEEGRIKKFGRTPKTVYRIITEDQEKGSKEDEPVFSKHDSGYLQQEFAVVTQSGDLLEGPPAFIYWSRQRKLPLQKTFTEYFLTKKKYASYYDPDGMINGIEKLKNTKGYDHIWLDELYYLDFYAIERFGKTKLGTLLHYAKQGQNKFLMRIMMDAIGDRVRTFVQARHADAIGFVPPTIRRELQIMKFIQSQLRIPLPVIAIQKISGIIPVPQKSLSKLDERIKNADNTFSVTEGRAFEHVVLIDDAVGSGSTLNEIAGKIKDKGVAKKITGLAIVGSFKGFDVITDV